MIPFWLFFKQQAAEEMQKRRPEYVLFGLTSHRGGLEVAESGESSEMNWHQPLLCEQAVSVTMSDDSWEEERRHI